VRILVKLLLLFADLKAFEAAMSQL
jgi:hypothetical protein